MQKDRVFQLTKMIVRCMLVISIVESEGFREFLNQLDPKCLYNKIWSLTSLMIDRNK